MDSYIVLFPTNFIANAFHIIKNSSITTVAVVHVCDHSYSEDWGKKKSLETGSSGPVA